MHQSVYYFCDDLNNTVACLSMDTVSTARMDNKILILIQVNFPIDYAIEILLDVESMQLDRLNFS
ncbi:hypothetical protein GCM10009411_23140 [Shewanella litoralis]|jgi:hypothetical protein|uniref:Uncharacterized protein n=3 Tax=Shewanella TaxID=22 RepID=A0ABQ2RDA5_9GAMM|nr:hypothetical protein GCM10011607_10880 [Shewanella inventionis]GGP69809.1 hypothetical protein GCM10009409_38150 [Shewanella saliphila]GGQ22517.1 hypothetical protein GCM10009411_23140 [Shewanella litoralis]